MKTAIYLEQGTTQLVLTPENEWERSVVTAIAEGSQHVSIKHGGFYYCQGEWYRENSGRKDSLMILLQMRAKDEFGRVTIPSMGA